MNTFAPKVTHYLTRFRQGDDDGAFHGLLELDHALLPDLEAEFRNATDTRLRIFLLNVIWQHRQQSVIPLLAAALFDAEPGVWREALNGLVTLASPAALKALQAASGREFEPRRDTQEFSRWLEEAVEQTRAEMQRA